MKGNLLIIDDEQLLTENLSHILKRYADEIFIANSGIEGLKVLADNKIHCVICDIHMPVMTGLDVIRKVREAGDNVPFIFFTAYGQEDVRAQTAQYDRTLFLTKPNILEMTKIISTMLKLGQHE